MDDCRRFATVILRPGYRYGEHTRRCGRCQPVADDADVPSRRYLRCDHRTRAQTGRRAGERLDRLLTEFEVPHDVKIYPGAGHGFMNDHDPADATLLLRFLARISGTKYDDEATRDARRRITAFFDVHLRGTAD
jgi:acetyl esterase/lipase